MKSLRILAIGAALIAGGSALASAQPNDHRDGRDDRSNRSFNNDRGADGGNNFNRGNNGDNRGQNFGRARDNHNFQGGRPNGIYWKDNDRRVDNDRRYAGDRDDRRYFGDHDRDRVVVRESYYVGERRFFNGYYWTWDGDRWCRRDHGVSFYFRF
jgi:hypothetical protein